MAFTALYDACVLYPAPLRDLLIRLAGTGLYRAKWSEDIHQEWMRNVLKNRTDLTPEKLQRTRELMDKAILDCLVQGYERLIPALNLPDPDDNHVLAAAIRSRADVIVTYNLKDFPLEILDEYGIEAQHPDDFIHHLLDLASDKVYMVVREQRLSLKNPAVTSEELLRTLLQSSLAQTVARLTPFAALL